MNSQPTLFVALKNLGLFALLGFAVVLLAGPIIGVLSVLLSVGAVVLLFAVVGFLVWGAFQAAVKGPEAAINGLKDMAGRGQALLDNQGGNMKQVVSWPLKAIQGLVGGLLIVSAFVFRTAWTSFWFLTEVAIVAIVGVLVGGGFGYAMAEPNAVEATTISYAAIGGVLAALTGAALTLRERQIARNHLRRVTRWHENVTNPAVG